MLKNDEFQKNNTVDLIKSGTYFAKLSTAIGEAKERIYFHTYIFSDDFTGNAIANELMNSARKGIKVFLLIDGFASRQLPKIILQKFIKSGIEVVLFEPLFKSKDFYFGRRMHQKVIVIDENIAFIGGMNIADRYNNRPEQKAWLDFAVEVKGNVVTEIANYCKEFWKSHCKIHTAKEIEKTKKVNNFFVNPEEVCLARVRINDWIRHRNEVSNTYIQLFKNARKEVYILCSYFIPGRAIRRQIVSASKKGIKIKIVMAGKSDVPIAKYAERWLYDWLLRNKVVIYEYQPNVLHGKIAVSDELMVTIGSYNINNISTYASLEMNLDIMNKHFAQKVKSEIDNIVLKDCIQITNEIHKKRKNAVKQFSRWVSYQTIRLLFFVFTFYFKRKKINYHKSAE
jgi:cardiolipin synthase